MPILKSPRERGQDEAQQDGERDRDENVAAEVQRGHDQGGKDGRGDAFHELEGLVLCPREPNRVHGEPSLGAVMGNCKAFGGLLGHQKSLHPGIARSTATWLSI